MSTSTIPGDPHALAAAVAQSMFARDSASRGLGMQIVRVAPGEAELSMTVRPDMLNGHAICHGGFIFTLADSAFAFACNSANLTTVANGCSIEFLAPAQLGDVLTAIARERVQVGRNGIYDVEVRDAAGTVIALFRGKSTRIKGTVLEGPNIMTARIPRPDELEPIERASADELAALQLARMKDTLARAYVNVPHYRKAFDARGVHPRDLVSLGDIAKFPFTVKSDLRDNYPFGMFAVPREEVVRIHASSGTTGKPTVVGYTRNDIDTWATVMARSIRAAGGRAGDIVHVAYGYGLFTGGLGAHYGAEKLGCTVIPMSGGMTERQVQLIADFRPSIIMVTPSYMLAIAEEMERQGMDPRASSLSIGIFGAEPWTPTMREAIEARMGIDAIDIYGLSEVIGPGVAQECIETKDGLTVWEDHFYPEVIDPATGEVLPEGEKGELVFTSLTKEALPIIRYRTRDLTRLLPPSARSMRRIEKITGRSDDMMIIRGVNVFPTQIEELILRDAALAPHYQVEITRPRSLDEMAILVERSAIAGSADGEAAGARLAHLVKSLIGVTADVRVLAPGGIERSLGKAKRVVDKRGVMGAPTA